MNRKSLIILNFFLLAYLQSLLGQDTMENVFSDSILYELEPITITASRFPVRQDKVSFALTALDNIHINSIRQNLSIYESLNSVPGLFAMNANNFAQDLRLSIRGFGSRAAFGIRGIKILIDGIPETTPDGQTQLDNLNISVIDHAEILRGPVSSLYGNASGGVIQFSTMQPPEEFMIEGRLSAGSYGFQGLQIKAGQKHERFGYLVSAAANRISGYRDHSTMKNFLFNGILNYQINPKSDAALRMSIENSPEAFDAGSLTKDQVEESRTQAYEGNVVFNAGEKVSQVRIGLTYQNEFSQTHKLQSVFYYNRRVFSNRLPFEDGGMVDLNRNYTGMTVSYYFTSQLWQMDSKLVTGIDLSTQKDDRKRFNNRQGAKGNLVFDQDEKFSNLGIYLQHDLQMSSNWLINYGIRHDAVNISANDKFRLDADNSGERIFRGWNVMLGSVFNWYGKNNIYGNISSGFETPALIELSSNPDGSGGFNSNLNPQNALNLELGLRGIIIDRFRYELAVFAIGVRDEIIPYELEQTPGRTYYQNAGKSEHKGIEISFHGNLLPSINLSINYTYSNFKFKDFEKTNGNLKHNYIPGIPEHMLNSIFLFIFPQGLFSRLELLGRGGFYADDENSAREEAALISNFQIGYTIKTASWKIEPYIGINNILNAKYSDNIRINAFGGRYYEPAPLRHIFLGIGAKF
jgi:iron complex outermembrane recepter protein